MMSAVQISTDYYRFDDDDYVCASFPILILRCPFCIRDDEEFMLQAFQSEPGTFQHASERLRSSRDFVVAALALNQSHDLGYSFMEETTKEFQVQNLDLIVLAIESEKCQAEWCKFNSVFDDDGHGQMWIPG
jgi:hypothetical protein